MKPELTMTSQEVLDFVSKKLIEQGRPSVRVGHYAVDKVGPAYRGADNCKCGIGHLIPDELYDGRFEGLNFAAVFDSHMGIMTLADPNMANFIYALQLVHDTFFASYTVPKLDFAGEGKSTFLNYIDNGFKSLAERFRLNYAGLN